MVIERRCDAIDSIDGYFLVMPQGRRSHSEALFKGDLKTLANPYDHREVMHGMAEQEL